MRLPWYYKHIGIHVLKQHATPQEPGSLAEQLLYPLCNENDMHETCRVQEVPHDYGSLQQSHSLTHAKNMLL